MHSLDRYKSSPALFQALLSSLTMQLRFRLAYAPTPHLGLDERLALLDVLLEPEAGQRGSGAVVQAMMIERNNKPARRAGGIKYGWPSARGGQPVSRSPEKPPGTAPSLQS
jgi:hypothetical protein